MGQQPAVKGTSEDPAVAAAEEAEEGGTAIAVIAAVAIKSVSDVARGWAL